MRGSFIFACLVTASLAAQAQYPARPILLVVPYSAGSDADLAARNLAQHAPRYLNGQTLVVMNQPGASGSIGTLAVRNAAPDGYRLLLTRIASQVILPATDRKTAYGATDFTFLSLLELNPYVCAVKNDAPYASMKDLVADIRKRPGKLNFATVGDGSLQNFGPQYFVQPGRPAERCRGRHPLQGVGRAHGLAAGRTNAIRVQQSRGIAAALSFGRVEAADDDDAREPLMKDLLPVSADRPQPWLARDATPRGMVGAGWSAETAARNSRALTHNGILAKACARPRVACRRRQSRRHRVSTQPDQ